jgi:glycosyltransferase involved in cell wall biosynthesis
LYGTADIYVYPTRLEGIGLSIAEASASGLPVITTNYPPMNEFIDDHKNGSLIHVSEEVMRSDNYYWPQAIIDLEDLIQKINWYLIHYDQIPYLKTRCRAIAVNKLNWEKNASELPDLIRRVETSNIDEKKKAIEQALQYDKKRPIKYYIDTFLPYVKLKRKIKKIIKSG